MASEPRVSPLLRALIDKGLFDRLPLTFSTFFFDRIKDWDLLFPAEHSYHERLFTLLDRSDPSQVDALFAPVRAAEQKMGVSEKNWPRRQFTLDQVDFLNRSPHYPEWRQAITNVFARLDPVLDADVARAGHARLVVVTSPAELPVGPDRMWLRIRERGKRIAVDWQELPDFAPLLRAASVRGRYDTWAISSAPVKTIQGSVALSYEGLKAYRARLTSEVQHIVEKEEIRGPRQLGARLKELKLLASEGDLGRDAVLAEFTRAVLLSGNGTLLINNTFVEWAAVQAVRRARPTVVLVSFGIRNKVKPFTGLLIFADQETASPVPTQMDTLGTYVDLEIFYQYIWQEFEKYPEYQRNTAYLFLADGMDEMLVIAPADFSLLSAKGAVSASDALTAAREWLHLEPAGKEV
jgi:hypothetical protein